ncbi:Endophilin-B1 [Halotydeus destructor]|nr:Endophilin-B1 [Halotydeus destructor]
MSSFSFKGLKGLAAEAGTALTRAKQYTEEKLGSAEKTELEPQLEQLLNRVENVKRWTEKIAANTEAVLQPNPNTRVEDYLFEKFDKQREQERMRNLEWLGADMIDAGNDFGSDTVYGSALAKVGLTQQRLGETEREYVGLSYRDFIRPLKSFLDGDMKMFMREKRTLEAKRLDLDAAKSKLRKAKTADAQSHAERDLSVSQDEFDKQVEVTKKVAENVLKLHAAQAKHLSDFVEKQIVFYATSHQHMCDLQKELATLKLASNLGTINLATNQSSGPSASDLVSPTDQLPKTLPNGKRRARVLFDYEARNATELTLGR